jgi:tetratricopeptide (TPR) repeat protein
LIARASTWHWALLSLVVPTTTLAAQFPVTVQPVRCARPMPAPLASVRQPVVSVRMMAEGAFPRADAAAARALIVLIRDVISERAPVSLLSSIDVQARIASSMPAANDTRALASGARLMTAVVQRVADSVVATWTMRTAGRPTFNPVQTRTVARVDDITRIALVLAKAAAVEAEALQESMGTPPPPLGSIEAGEVYILGLAEALSSSPISLRRSHASLVRATTLAPTLADAWRWRARVERSLLEWSRDSEPDARDALRASLLTTARRAEQLAPRSPDTRLVMVDALLIAGQRRRAEAGLENIAREDSLSAAVLRRQALFTRLHGDDELALQLLRRALALSPRDGTLLVDAAQVALSTGEQNLACHALNAAIVADESLAPAYALRALVRGALGDHRNAWVDAEVASRLGHAEWGERVAAILDVRYGDPANARVRLATLGPAATRPSNFLDAFLTSRMSVALARPGAAAFYVAPWICKEFWWSLVVRDARLLGAKRGFSCAA